jgi:hypothetical protein
VENETTIRDRITTLEEQVSKLRERLETVLVPSPPTTAGVSPQPATSHVRGRLESLIDQVSDISGRLEL